MKVKITRAAEADLEAIADWIAADNPIRALSFINELREKCQGLDHQPKRFPVFGTLDGEAVRKRSHRSYAIFYLVRPDSVDIIHILHGARDLPAALGTES
jgi:toxin ParE1/3/4